MKNIIQQYRLAFALTRAFAGESRKHVVLGLKTLGIDDTQVIFAQDTNYKVAKNDWPSTYCAFDENDEGNALDSFYVKYSSYINLTAEKKTIGSSVTYDRSEFRATSDHLGPACRGLVTQNRLLDRGEKAMITKYVSGQLLRAEISLNQLLPKMDTTKAKHRGKYSRLSGKIGGAGVPVDSIYKDIASNRRIIIDEFSKLGKTDLIGPAVKRAIRNFVRDQNNFSFKICEDGRARSHRFAMRAKSGRDVMRSDMMSRNQILRPLIKPNDGWGLIYTDRIANDFGIAAALSGDPLMRGIYESDIPLAAMARSFHLAFGAKDTELSEVIKNLKSVERPISYGAGIESVADNLDGDYALADFIMSSHKRKFKTLWEYIYAYENAALIKGYVSSVEGFRHELKFGTPLGFIKNFPIQARSAEIERETALRLDDAGIKLISLNHDALLAEAPMSNLFDVAEQIQKIQTDTAREFLDGFTLKVKCQIVPSAGRLKPSNPIACRVWNEMMRILVTHGNLHGDLRQIAQPVLLNTLLVSEL